MFVNCAFNSNKVGFMIDNKDGNKPNNGHGSAIGCTFNHTDNNNGYAFKLYNAKSGFIFEGCQVFYGKTLIERSDGIAFTSCNFGRAESVTVKKGGVVLFSNCMFGSQPNIMISDNDHTHFDNCYVRTDGDSVESEKKDSELTNIWDSGEIVLNKIVGYDRETLKLKEENGKDINAYITVDVTGSNMLKLVHIGSTSLDYTGVFVDAEGKYVNGIWLERGYEEVYIEVPKGAVTMALNFGTFQNLELYIVY